MTIEYLSSSMNNITITNQDFIETTEFTYGDCGTSRVYLSGLKEGESVVSEDPFLIQNVNGVIAGIDQRFGTLNLVKNDQVVESIQLSWTNSCKENTQSIISATSFSGKNIIDLLGIPTLLVIFSFGFALLIFRIRK